MKYIDHKQAVIAFLILVGILLAGCLPAAIDETSQQDLNISPTFTETEQPTKTQAPTITSTLTVSPLLISTPTQTITSTFPVLIQATNTKINVPIVLPTNTKKKHSTLTATLTSTSTPTPSNTPTVTLCPQATAEPLWVDPVTSPTDQLTQVITVYIGNGEEVTIITESGTFTVTGQFNPYTNPAKVEITLLPNTVHHLEVIAKVRSGLSGPGNCIYGGYGLTTRTDRNGAPLVIAQGSATP